MIQVTAYNTFSFNVRGIYCTHANKKEIAIKYEFKKQNKNKITTLLHEFGHHHAV